MSTFMRIIAGVAFLVGCFASLSGEYDAAAFFVLMAIYMRLDSHSTKETTP